MAHMELRPTHWNLNTADWWAPLGPLTDRPFSVIVLGKLMEDVGITPSRADVDRRKRIIDILKRIVEQWIGSRSNNGEVNAEIIPYGSYALEVYSQTSDMDLLVIAPTMQEDILEHLHGHILTIPNVNNVRVIVGARIPLLKFVLDGIDIDIACARLKPKFNVPRPEDLQKENFCLQSAIDHQSRATLQSVRSNYYLLQAVGANKEIFVQATRLLKCWADCRGIYGNVNCYLGGVHLTILLAYVAIRCPGMSLAGVIASFFETFLNWNWKQPVSLHVLTTTPSTTGTSPCLRVVQPGTNEFCPSNVTPKTIQKIDNELVRGYQLTRVLSCNWSLLLEPFPYHLTYRRFIKVRVSVLVEGELDKWTGFAKSRIPFLVRTLEADGISCDPVLTEYFDLPSARPTGFKAQNNVFLWGIVGDTGQKYNLSDAEDKWRANLAINNDGSNGEVKLAVVKNDDLRKYNMLNRRNCRT